ncbi:MAG TPA: polymer-forming cytoskeletal protein [Steroidobacteraceae bacterium]|nr:polymer-forming cytoskeletal protein [Steroidobacteraceae bacterium]
MSNPYDTAVERTSVLGPTLRFKGELSADEDLLIQGSIEGSIRHTQRVTVGPEGKVKANIHAALIVVEGTVEGDLHAAKAVNVKETANVRGNIQAPAVSITEGAKFNGGIEMAARAGAEAPAGAGSDASRSGVTSQRAVGR